MSLIEIDCVIVRFNLPEWVTDERHERRRPVYYSERHIWAGQWSHDETWNQISHNILNLKHADETYFHPWGPWVQFKFDSNGGKLQREINEAKAKLERLLMRYKEAHRHE